MVLPDLANSTALIVSLSIDDQYICASQPAIDELYIVNFIPKASMKFVHHMLLFGCESVHHSYLEGYNRGCTYGECTAGRAIMFAWARDADSPVIPPDVGFHIGGDSGVNYLTLQIHYATAAPFADGSTDSSGLTLVATTEEQKYMGGIFLNVGMNIHVDPNSPNSHTDVACEYKDTVPIYAFGFRTHAHSLGKVITGFRIRNNKWEEIAQGNPQWPQAFYPMDEIYQIQRGDVIATRCTFDGTRTDHEVHVGSKHTDEMCNLYIMYYTDSALGESFKVCSQQASRDLFSHVPLGWDTDTPPLRCPRQTAAHRTGDDDDDINMLEDKLKTDVQDQIQRIGGNDDDGDG
ncbi:putative peptidyl-glycine alpha-amidating monooxygenase B-like [Apostichopus japonicus]|uniref:peptidylglycine monooxygenase n=1 Tax=Stichopus japonicus TaxID=307972 RepID=A0A2G8LAP2_STIJA|nr:putative peptidyl-glycine alpha-amidating monooxygenase B-like [Apostichopus japonicus]